MYLVFEYVDNDFKKYMDLKLTSSTLSKEGLNEQCKVHFIISIII